jgi:hypothetical protein
MDSELNMLTSSEAYRVASQNLSKEGLKVESMLQMMNVCADSCNLRYFESGLKDAGKPGVECFSNCVTKSYQSQL